VVNAKFFTPLTTGFFSPFVGQVTGASVLTVLNGRYEAGGTIAVLYDNASGTAGNLLSLDTFTNTANAITSYYTRTGGAGANVVLNSVPSDAALAYDMSGYSLGVGVLYVGENASNATSGSTHGPQFTANSASVVGSVTGNNLLELRSGIAALLAQDTNGNIGIKGNYIAGQSPCLNTELVLSAGWQSTGSATVTGVAGTGQTCSWIITTGTTTAANPTVTDTLTNALPTSGTVCSMYINYGPASTHTAVAGEGFAQTLLSATAPVFTFNGTPTAAGKTYLVTRQCGP
jgi:hypothetical protein